MTRTLDFLVENSRWLAAGALLMSMSSFGQTFFISIFAGEIRAAFNLTHGEWGTLYAIGTMASAFVMIWAGVLTDRFRARTLGTLFLICLAGSCLLMAINTYAAVLPIVVFCLRFTGQGMTSHIATVAMARWFVKTRGRALATASLGYSFSEMTFPVAFVFLMTFFDWQHLWIICACICCAAVFLMRSLLREERTPGHEDAKDEHTGLGGRHWRRNEVLRHRLFWFIAPALIGLPAFGTAFLFHHVHYTEVKSISRFAFVGLLPLYSSVVIGMSILSGIALDRFGTLRLVPYFLLPVSAGFAAFALTGSIFGLALGFVLFAITAGAYGTLTNALWAEVYGTAHIGAIKSLVAAIMVLGSALGPAIVGQLIDVGVGIEFQYVLVTGYFLFASACIWLGVRDLGVEEG